MATSERFVGAVIAVVLVSGFVASGILARIRPQPALELPPPNVVLIVWNTTRADRLSAYGYERRTTPHFDRLAADGALFEHAISPAIWTIPAHASLFTGLPASTHGADFSHHWLDERFVTMAEWLSDAGYETWAFSANRHIRDRFNFMQGFQHLHYPWDAAWERAARRATLSKLLPEDRSTALSPKYEPGPMHMGSKLAALKDSGPVGAQALRRFLEQRKNTRPFFAFVNYMEAHAPRIPSLGARAALVPQDQVDRQLQLDQSNGSLLAYSVGQKEYSDEELELIGSTYDAAIREMDAATGQLIGVLRDRHLLAHTIVILTADHGEHLGEHHRVGHKYSVYQPLVRVPLVIRYPMGVRPERVSETVSTANVLATVADLARIQAPPGTGESLMREKGRSGRAIAEMNEVAPLALRKLREVYPEFDEKPFRRTYQMMQSDGFTLIRDQHGRTELYDVTRDPLQTNDLAPDDPTRTESMSSAIDGWLAEIDTYDPSLRATSDVSPKLSREEKQQLEALGYVQDIEEENP